LPWKQDLHWIHCIEYIFFIIQDFWAACACPENRVCPEFTVLKYFYHSGFLSNLRLPWKQSLPWIHYIEYTFFIIQDFWATCACPENRVCPESTVLNIYFLSFRIFEQLALALKTTSCPDIFHCIEIFLSFRIFEQLALALKTEFALNSLYWIYTFYHSGFLNNLRLPLNFSGRRGGRPPRLWLQELISRVWSYSNNTQQISYNQKAIRPEGFLRLMLQGQMKKALRFADATLNIWWKTSHHYRHHKEAERKVFTSSGTETIWHNW